MKRRFSGRNHMAMPANLSCVRCNSGIIQQVTFVVVHAIPFAVQTTIAERKQTTKPTAQMVGAKHESRITTEPAINPSAITSE